MKNRVKRERPQVGLTMDRTVLEGLRARSEQTGEAQSAIVERVLRAELGIGDLEEVAS
jgi:hypothetical protein